MLIQAGKLTVVKEGHSLNASPPILVQEGKLTEVKEKQLANAQAPIVAQALKLTDSKVWLPSKHPEAMFLTLLSETSFNSPSSSAVK